ncbi:hypothetical protein [Porphyrobacter sp. AAP60]|uniref:hypothetical protein n=1 Tax=Porphyrobacter sp. AAP60 TaxID=1523423 RepID=UPI0006B9A9BD|nr:hypothetical protein [Porphyrobacter sp. AAP60]KPF64510.1 hypothetical protein IP79_05085 [Porphyrobacter sp. AAP60]
MSVRFAAANNPVRRIGWRAAGRGLVAPALARAVNDNGDPVAAAASFDPLLADALKHFAVHGLASAKAALTEAEDAAQRGDGNARAHWLAITGLFDRRLADRARRRPNPA